MLTFRGLLKNEVVDIIMTFCHRQPVNLLNRELDKLLVYFSLTSLLRSYRLLHIWIVSAFKVTPLMFSKC